MTQTQRKKALAEAQERLRLADEALKAAQDARTDAYLAVAGLEREARRNEPLTEAMKNCLILMYRNGLPLVLGTWSGRKYWINAPGGTMNIRSSVFDGFQSRELLGSPVSSGTWHKDYPLSDWGREVAEALAGKGGS